MAVRAVMIQDALTNKRAILEHQAFESVIMPRILMMEHYRRQAVSVARQPNRKQRRQRKVGPPPVPRPGSLIAHQSQEAAK